MRFGHLIIGSALALALAVPAAAQSDVSRILNRLRTGNTQPATAPDAPPPVFTEQAITYLKSKSTNIRYFSKRMAL